LYLAAAYRLLFESQFEKAASMASRIDQTETKNTITDAINFNWTGSLLASGNTTEALALARSIRAQEPRVVALVKVGAIVATKGDAAVAEEIFNESQTLASKSTPSAVISAAVLSIASTRASAQRDATRAFEAQRNGKIFIYLHVHPRTLRQTFAYNRHHLFRRQ
jgi:fructoselysine-6-P-deglycase FrlB-like protein